MFLGDIPIADRKFCSKRESWERECAVFIKDTWEFSYDDDSCLKREKLSYTNLYADDWYVTDILSPFYTEPEFDIQQIYDEEF